MSDIEDLEAERVPGAPVSPPPPARAPRRRRVGLAFAVAIVADVLQWVLWPLFLAGFASPVTDVLDVVIGAAMVWLLGFHWAFLPTFAAELIPGVDLVPCWTLAVWLATRGKKP
jgi:hypothetical protein